MNKRQTSVAGTFYPAECKEIKRYIDTFNEAFPIQSQSLVARAMISPHAGYVYSGFTANAAYSLLDTKTIRRVLVIGPSHRVYLKGASVALYEDYESPCHDLKIDMEYSAELVKKYAFLSFDPAVHREHSTETQVPFVEHYFGSVSLVEIVYGDIDYKALVPIITEALQDEETFVVISTDLSHFYTLDAANKRDAICLKAIENMNISELDSGCEACGMIGVKAVLEASKEKGLRTKVIDYRTSFDASSDESSVVGYLSVLIGEL